MKVEVPRLLKEPLYKERSFRKRLTQGKERLERWDG